MKFPFNLNNPMNWVKMGLVGILGAGAYWLGTRNCINPNNNYMERKIIV